MTATHTIRISNFLEVQDKTYFPRADGLFMLEQQSLDKTNVIIFTAPLRQCPLGFYSSLLLSGSEDKFIKPLNHTEQGLKT